MYKVITPPTTEPITLSEAKEHLRVTETDEDTLINNLIIAAREYCEEYTGRALAAQTVEAYFDYFAEKMPLPRPPLVSVTSVKYKDSAGTEVTLTANTDYLVDTDSVIGQIARPYSVNWPSFTPYPINPIKVRYQAGYTSLPKAIHQAILMLIGHWYANREAVGDVGGEVAKAVTSLLIKYKAAWSC
jgi:uncharacterized phiE125 gp8 family phage protein